ncbi:hypothetical protein BDV26DRAFT_282542 [Aspergillus bertholletiae]|uniref:Uncharacterized protein n=1 Tax=Aspergillus bertholletiae TaxID=1226010 RepID=A0A5N7B589_9EURO|nr:hypothetical protein BDV26DRAFT_282542 [Aspergillus bertholletiae]
MDAWKTSLTNMDALIIGTSQAIKSGELLLAAYAWHLFPHISSVSTVSTGSVDRDRLFQSSATITIGLDESPMRSIYWSLPLARVRHDENDKKRKLDKFLDNSGHRRWLCAGGGLWREFLQIDSSFYTYKEERDLARFSSIDEFFSFEEKIFPDGDQRGLVDEAYRKSKARYESIGEVISKREDLTLSDLTKASNSGRDYLHQTSVSRYTFLYGDEHSTALFILGDTPRSLSRDWIARTDLRHFSSLLESGAISPSAFARSFYASLEALDVGSSYLCFTQSRRLHE